MLESADYDSISTTYLQDELSSALVDADGKNKSDKALMAINEKLLRLTRSARGESSSRLQKEADLAPRQEKREDGHFTFRVAVAPHEVVVAVAIASPCRLASTPKETEAHLECLPPPHTATHENEAESKVSETRDEAW
eukprot:TRINITY_DN6185_c0_g1_i1.p1 TRINITY_DN6185_c0_g1~~TRINITY_DN6185_c0_g1_i1.p1  ORF type:complete len:138 (-),score=8.35 TRINITY_DN6185_c0_g1_i1:1059-1472(-)